MMKFFRKSTRQEKTTEPAALPNGTPDGPLNPARRMKPVEYEFAPDDPLMQYLVDSSGVVAIDKLELDSPALEFLKGVGVKITVPLVSQGELIGMLNLGPRLSEQEYSSDDIRLLNSLATQAAPALRVAQLARQQQAEARQRERMEQELRIARVIQETLLPQELPDLENWQLDALWKPAREVSGDFYDFIKFPDGRLAIITGDVTGKGVPAALVMATTRSILRAAAERLVQPGAVLERANELLCADIPHNMFITCLYVLLDPASGQFRFANAGHNLPQKTTSSGAVELRATGMPLGLMPGMTYEEKEATLLAGEELLLYSDGLVEAHDPQGEMFGFPRLNELLSTCPPDANQIELLMKALSDFTGPDWEQEDDVTFVSIRHLPTTAPVTEALTDTGGLSILADFSLASGTGAERMAMEDVAKIVLAAGFPHERIEALKTAVAEGTLNAIEHGNKYNSAVPATIRVLKSADRLVILITDLGGEAPIPEHVEPDLEAKLAGLQSPRGWGLFLIQNMVDDMKIYTDAQRHTLELTYYLTAPAAAGGAR
jgi:serine phosphatase RsbU (regulator of sigma subunit)/anti-sigma regulatory factor (Ser/Thr protein kinase)